MIHDKLKPFYLLRKQDISGNSGVGVVAIGAVYPSGEAVMQFLGTHHTITIYKNLEEVGIIHGHDGCTEVVLGDPPGKKQTKKKK